MELERGRVWFGRVWFGHHDTAPLRFSFTVSTPWIVDCVVYVVVDALEMETGEHLVLLHTDTRITIT